VILPSYAHLTTIEAGLSDGSVLLRDSSGCRVIVSKDEFSMLEQCFGFVPLADHASRIAVVSPSTPFSQIEWSLLRFVENGLLVDAQKARSRIARSLRSRPRSQSSIDVIGVPTRDRPQALQRLLTELIAHFKEFNRHCEIVVVDDSRTSSFSQASREIVGSHQIAPGGNAGAALDYANHRFTFNSGHSRLE
jgi:hypothetical protein